MKTKVEKCVYGWSELGCLWQQYLTPDKLQTDKAEKQLSLAEQGPSTAFKMTHGDVRW